MFWEICEDEARLKQHEVMMAKIFMRLGLPAKVVWSGWLYPASIDEGPKLLLFNGGDEFEGDDTLSDEQDEQPNRESELDSRWLYDGRGYHLYGVGQ